MIDTLNFQYIPLIPESNLMNGSVKDFGNFKEGYCFKVRNEIPEKVFKISPTNLKAEQTKYFKWVVCAKDNETKSKFMNIIIKLKIKQQRELNLYVDFQNEKEKTKENSPLKNKIEKAAENIFGLKKVGKIFEKTKDCTMIIIRDWTECTLTCGGGKSYMQLMKIFPKKEGEDCKTKELIQVRECNMQPCPNTEQIKQMIEPQTEPLSKISQAAEIKVVSISNRPRRYDKCHLKEDDAILKIEKKTENGLKFIQKTPVRIVMTEKVLTAYQDDTLANKYSSYLLEESTFFSIKDEKCCFKIKNNVQEDVICTLKSENNSRCNFVEEWDYDFNLFKNQCSKPRALSNQILEEEKLKNEFKERVENLKLEFLKEKSVGIKKKSNLEEQNLMSKKIDGTRLLSLNAIAKEMKLEDMIEKEEENKEKDDNNKLQMQMKYEESKKERILKAIKEKEIETQYNIAKSHAEEAINNIAKETKNQILSKRRNIAKKITEMRMKQKRKQSEIQSNILSIRYEIAKKLQESNKAGNAELCLKGLDNGDKYCTVNFADNFIKFRDCKNSDSFCYVCCENEFGDLHLYERDKCYTECDKKKKNK